MIHANVAYDAGDPWPMRRLIRDASTPDRVAELRKAQAFLTKAGVDWQDRYVGFVEPGRPHTVKIVGVSDRQFIGIENNASILVGWRKDLPEGRQRPGQIVGFIGRGAPTNGVTKSRSTPDP